MCLTSVMLGSEDLVKTNSHPGDPYSLTVEVSNIAKEQNCPYLRKVLLLNI